jgi:hypothetical protein
MLVYKSNMVEACQLQIKILRMRHILDKVAVQAIVDKGRSDHQYYALA